MPGGARRYKDRWNRRGNRGAAVRKGLRRSGRAARTRDIPGHAGTLCAHTGGAFPAEREKDFCGRKGVGAVLAAVLACKENKVGEGQTVPIQTVVGVIDAAGSAAAAPAPAPAPAPAKAQAPGPAKVPAAVPAAAPAPKPVPGPVTAAPMS